MKKLIVALFLFSIPLFSEDMEMDDLIVHDINEIRVISELSDKNPAWLKLDANYSIKEGVDPEYVSKHYRVTCDDIAYYANNKPVSLGIPIFPFSDDIQTCSIVKLKNPDNWKWGEWENEVKFQVRYDMETLKPLINEQIKDYMLQSYSEYSKYFDYTFTTGNGIKSKCSLLDLMRYPVIASNINRTVSYPSPHFTFVKNRLVMSIDLSPVYVDMYFKIDDKNKLVKLDYVYTPKDGYSNETNNVMEINGLCEVFSKWPEYVVSPYDR